jgi:glutamate carboxypeptidase
MPAFHFSRPNVAALIAVALVAGAATARAAPADAALLAAANAAQPAVIASLKDMVSIESGSTNAAGLAKMADYVEARLKAIGARTERIAPARGRERW